MSWISRAGIDESTPDNRTEGEHTFKKSLKVVDNSDTELDDIFADCPYKCDHGHITGGKYLPDQVKVQLLAREQRILRQVLERLKARAPEPTVGNHHRYVHLDFIDAELAALTEPDNSTKAA